jgi:hypothetical protein
MDSSTPSSEHTVYIDPDEYEAAWKAARATRSDQIEYHHQDYYSIFRHDAACGLEHVGCSKYRVVDARKWIIAKLRYAW